MNLDPRRAYIGSGTSCPQHPEQTVSTLTRNQPRKPFYLVSYKDMRLGRRIEILDPFPLDFQHGLELHIHIQVSPFSVDIIGFWM